MKAACISWALVKSMRFRQEMVSYFTIIFLELFNCSWYFLMGKDRKNSGKIMSSKDPLKQVIEVIAISQRVGQGSCGAAFSKGVHFDCHEHC